MSSGPSRPILISARRFLHSGKCPILFWIALFAAATPETAQAQVTSVWNGGAGTWETGTSWSPTGIPGTSLHDVYIDNGNGVVSMVTLNSDQLIGRLSIDSGDSLTIGGNMYLTLQGGGFAGSGTLNLNGTLNMNPSSQLRLGTNGGQTFYLNGPGTLNLGTGSIWSAYSGNTLVSQAAITGSGTISGIDIVNNGSISAQGVNGIQLTPSSTVTNNGTITALAGSKVTIHSGTWLNAGQVMAADGASSQLAVYGNSVIRGGTLRGINGGEVLLYSDSMLLDGATSGAITLEGQTRIQGNYWPYILGEIINNGTISTGPNSQLRIASGQSATLGSNASGQLVLDGAHVVGFAGSQFTNGVGHAIVGNGGFYVDTINNGTITATGASGISMNMASFTNNGTVTASSGSKVTINSGTWLNAGQVMAADGASSQLAVYGNSVIRGGTLRGINGGEVLLYSDSMLLDGATSGAITLEGQTRIQGNYWPYILGEINNNGTITTGAASQVRISSGQSATIGSSDYSGVLELNNASIVGFGGGSVFTNGFGHTIRGSGSIGNGGLQLVNQGTIGGGPGTVNISPATQFINEYFGTVKADSGGTVNFTSGAITNAGSSWPSGTFWADNGGSIHLTGSATLTNYSAGTLTNGFYAVTGSGQLNLGIGNITTLSNAGVYLDGAAAVFNPVNPLAVISGGSFEITNGRNFTTAGGLSNQNYGQLIVGNGSTLTVNGTLDNSAHVFVRQGGTLNATASQLAQFNAATNTLTAGSWNVGGTLKFAGGDINRLAGKLRLMGPSAQVLKQDGSNAIGGLVQVETTGELAVDGGAIYTGPSSFVNRGLVSLGNSSTAGTLILPGTYTQESGTTFLGGGSLVSGGNIFIDAGELAGNGLLQPGGSTPTVTVDGTLNPMKDTFYGVAGAIEIAGQLGLAGGTVYQWSLASYLDNSSGAAGEDWDVIEASQGVFGGSIDFTLANWTVSNPDSVWSFWQTNHEWDVLIADQGGISAGFSLTNGTYSAGTFSLATVSSGGSTVLRLIYSAAAVPEPAQGLVLGLAVLALAIRRRRV